ncbi:hypothetical protein STSP2_01401 [Anaerohalosphaera lusitana]|uniref:Uncharacterized protein n=1 Tax=Anaerohalosphaera lusitana TaxID=1936003 RepID=A0A1U9NK99_9BACT|nr:hypothetical protein STSP2_01401 [Anaerohalosphaera lusitana]
MGIRAITDNQGKTLDRYTICFCDGSLLNLSHNCDSPQGVFMWGEGCPSTDDKRISFDDLPSNVQRYLTRKGLVK